MYDPRPYVPKSDEEALKCAVGMAQGLSDYDVQILKDGKPADLSESTSTTEKEAHTSAQAVQNNEMAYPVQ